MQNKFKLVIFSIICLVTFNNLFAASAPGKFISMTDIHFNPFLNCKADQSSCPLIDKLQKADYQSWGGILKQNDNQTLSTYRQNTNFALFESALLAIKNVEQREHPKFLLVMGDLFAHEMKSSYVRYTGDNTTAGYEAFIKKNMQFLAYEIKQKLPNIDTYLLIGNNDSYTGDYGIVPNGKFFQDTATIWSSLIKNSQNKTAFLKDFPNSGYYSIVIPKTHHRIIALDTVLFSTYAIQATKNAALQELNWLDNQLKSAKEKQEPVLLAMHIPMGIDVFMTINNKQRAIVPFWQNEFTQKFKEVLDKYPNVIVEILAGHIHKDAFQILTLKGGAEIPVTYTPSISPIYRNNPGFKLYEYDNKTFKILNYDVYYTNSADKNTKWVKEYSFNHQYQNDCKQCNLLTGIKKLLSSENLKSFYEINYMVMVNQDVTAHHELDYYQCGMNQFIDFDYKSCLKEKMPYKFFFWI